MKAAADAGKFGIGVNSNQNGLFPGKILTSMLKHVDVATYKSFMDAKNGTWKPGVLVLGLKDDGINYARRAQQQQGHCSAPKITAEADQAKAGIISGEIQVHRLRVRRRVAILNTVLFKERPLLLRDSDGRD